MRNVLLLRLSAMALLLNLGCWGQAVVASQDASVRRARTAVDAFKARLRYGVGGYATAKAMSEKDSIHGAARTIGGPNSSLYLSEEKYFNGSAADARCLHVYISLSESRAPDRAIAVMLLADTMPRRPFPGFSLSWRLMIGTSGLPRQWRSVTSGTQGP